MPAITLGAILALTGATLSPARAQLRFRADTAHGGLWKKLYKQLPSPWKARDLVYVREVTDGEMDRFVERFEGPNSKDNSIVDGCYQANTANDDMAGRITLRLSLRGENASLVFIHEYGHYVWGSLLTEADRARYRRIWREQRRCHSLITDYAGDSDEEGFAEAFAYFIHKPAALRRTDARSAAFLADLQDTLAEPDPDA
ncbi:MAG TPA: hypothetical protein VKT77_04665 [Chthonomonadaceae bacterium]|nr:hypothetical protein [Chthonomonadaceae bacterium]